MSYSRILAHYPYVVLGAVLVFAGTCLVVIMTVAEKPDFSDPKLGFEPRGTEISRRIRSHEKLLDVTQSDRIQHYRNRQRETKPQFRQDNNSGNTSGGVGNVDEDEDEERPHRDDTHVNISEPFFCGPPQMEYARVVFKSIDGSSLFTATNIHSMCELETNHVRVHHDAFDNNCVPTTYTHRCCRSWSIGNYVALLTNRSSCMDVTAEDVHFVLNLLSSCVEYYNAYKLLPNCYEAVEGDEDANKCKHVPAKCKQHNAVYSIMHYLADTGFMNQDKKSRRSYVKYAMTLLPIAASSAAEDLYKAMDGNALHDQHTEIVAVNFGIKHNLFDHYLKSDMVWFGLALATVFIGMCLYTVSLFLTAMTVVSIALAVGIAYFLYAMVFEIKFFPFMNLLAVVIVIGVGADDVFVYCKVWTLAKLEKNVGTLEKIISDTLKHASLSMFVTSFTTAAAFYASFVSQITALRCFAVYAGTVIMVNFIIMMTWVPASIVVYEKWCTDCLVCYSPDIYTPKKDIRYYLCSIPYKVYEKLCDWSRIFFEKILPCLVVKLRYLWFVLFGLLGLCGVVVIFYHPKLKLPSSNEFQVFSSDHPFEVYDFQVKDQFWFEKAAGTTVPTLPLTVVWGVEAADTGNHLDPFSEGELVYDSTFNVATKDSQQWLQQFCQKLRQTEKYKSGEGLQLTNCFIEHFIKFMERPCIDPASGQKVSPCCKDYPFPYEEKVFNQCLHIYRPWLAQSKELFYSNTNAGPRYSKETGKLVALVVEFNSKEPFSFNFKSMQQFYEYMNGWVTEQMLHAPKEMRNGWFISHLEFYDLQQSIAQGTPVAIGVSIAVATLVAFFTTLNILISLYAMISIAFAIFVTVGALVLLGWELNILESVTISVAVGLSMDFSLHYGMAYRLSPDLDQEMRVVCSLSRMGSPVAMAALTTFLAGALMMPSTVLAYRQLGIFLMLVMSISWAYATFFFQALLRIMGPRGGFGQFHWPTCDCCCNNQREHVDKTIYAMSESTLSSSSTNHANSSETHEMEPLTEREHYLHHHRARMNQKYLPSRYSQTGSSGSAEAPKRDSLVTLQPNNDNTPQVVAQHAHSASNGGPRCPPVSPAGVVPTTGPDIHERTPASGRESVSGPEEDETEDNSAILPKRKVSGASDLWVRQEELA